MPDCSGLSWQAIYEIPWVMKEVLFTRKVLERSWKPHWILSTHILQRLMHRQTHWRNPYGSPVRDMNVATWSRCRFQTSVCEQCSWVPIAEPEKRTIMGQNWPDTRGASMKTPQHYGLQGCSVKMRPRCSYLGRMNKIKRACWCWMLRQCLRHPWLTAHKLGLVLQVQSLFR